jgi:signal transduction histidine kinase
LLVTVVAMLWRLVRTESRFRREMQDFLGRVTHEMKTPLAGIKAVLQTVHSGRMPPDQLKELTSMALREADREEHLIQNLLLAQRMRMPDQRLARDRVDMTQVLTRFVQRRQVTAPVNGVHARVAEGLATVGDSTAIWTILENLADNAQKYGAKRIDVIATLEERHIHVQLMDDGIGFAPELAEKLFQPFVRTQGATSHASGTGLGLSLSRALAERMGGKLTAKSEGEGKGSTFALRLPVAPSADS